MARKFIVQHRRGTTSQWANSNVVLREGEIGIEYNEDKTMARLLIGNEEGRDALPFASVSKITNIVLLADNWVGDTTPYSQVLAYGTINGVTANSKIDLQPNATLLEYLQDEEISLVAQNNNGKVTIYALNAKPTIDITIQATVTEVIIE